MLSLPTELHYQIFTYLTIPCIISYLSTCSHSHVIHLPESFWSLRFLEDYSSQPLLPLSSWSSSQNYQHYHSLTILSSKLPFPRDALDLFSLTNLYLSDTYSGPFLNFSPLNNLRKLYFFRSDLSSFPLSLCDLPNLSMLNISNNTISTIPSEISNLLNLKELYIENNVLTNLPSEIGHLSTLSNLCANGNKLEFVPSELYDLSNLTHLSLYRNNLSIISPAINNLVNLKKLFLHHNPLLVLPSVINLPKLRVLKITPLIPIPDKLRDCSNLSIIRI